MSNPFLPYLPMYAAGAVPERPWWRLRADGTNGWIRCDGALLRGAVGIPASGFAKEMCGPWYATDDEAFAVLAAYDREHPLPCPAPMAGQVWATKDGDQIELVIILDGQGFHAGARQLQSAPDLASGYLVLGPTPWGRDVPWGPA